MVAAHRDVLEGEASQTKHARSVCFAFSLEANDKAN